MPAIKRRCKPFVMSGMLMMDTSQAGLFHKVESGQSDLFNL